MISFYSQLFLSQTKPNFFSHKHKHKSEIGLIGKGFEAFCVILDFKK